MNKAYKSAKLYDLCVIVFANRVSLWPCFFSLNGPVRLSWTRGLVHVSQGRLPYVLGKSSVRWLRQTTSLTSGVGLSHVGFHQLRQGYVYYLAPETPCFRGMSTGPWYFWTGRAFELRLVPRSPHQKWPCATLCLGETNKCIDCILTELKYLQHPLQHSTNKTPKSILHLPLGMTSAS